MDMCRKGHGLCWTWAVLDMDKIGYGLERNSENFEILQNLKISVFKILEISKFFNIPKFSNSMNSKFS
jgi:hypothetical protein